MRRRIELKSVGEGGQVCERLPEVGAGEASLDGDIAWVSGVQERLLLWYGESGRKLPWRASRDAYRILVSEMMLVQTTVAAVVPYFERFIARFPDAAALAAADESEVVKAWEGLGYYRRARQLHAAARTIVREHGGVMPGDPAAVRALPGVGRYIAGAILSFAMDRPEPIVEANSQRVLARLLAVREDIKVASTKERLWQAAARLVPAENAGAFNQALMDLGALGVHAARAWLPGLPVVAATARPRQLGVQDRLPVSRRRRHLRSVVTEAAVVLVRSGRVLILERGPGGLWEHFWEFPTVHLDGVNPAGRPAGRAADLQEADRARHGNHGPRSDHRGRRSLYSVTKHRVKLIVHLAEARSGETHAGPGLVEARWVEPGAAGRVYLQLGRIAG